MIKVKPHPKLKNLFDVIDPRGFCIGTWNTPKMARHKSRMWYMWITTGDELYLRK